jgi:integrase
LSRNSINKVHIVLGAIFEQAVRDNLLKVNHFRRDPASINAPTGREIRAQKPEIATWSAEELNAFLNWNQNVHNDDLFELWALMAASGVRRSEAIALRWDDINFNSGDMAVRRAADPAKSKAIKVTKTMTNRSVALDGQIISMLNSLRSRRGAAIGIQFVTGGSFIFPTLNNEMRNPNDVTARWSRTLAKAQRSIPELPHLTLKGLRHTNATHWLEAGVNPKIVQERLGHSNISMTMDTYSHVSGNLQRNAVEQVKNWFSQSA